MSILLTGGNGKTASVIAALLQEHSIPLVRTSRSGQAPAVRFDWTDASTYEAPFQGEKVKAVWLVAPKAFDLSFMKEFIELARIKFGVKRFVLLSSAAIPAGGPAMGSIHQYLVGSGVDYAVLRPTAFQENLSEPANLSARKFRSGIQNEDTLFTIMGDSKLAWISARDIAAVAFKALTNEKSFNKELVLMGPELLSGNDIAALLTRLQGRKISHVKVTAEELTERLTKAGVPLPVAGMLVGMEANIASGPGDSLNGTVAEITGWSGKTLATFLKENEAAFAKA